METQEQFSIPIERVHTPCYITDVNKLKKNTTLLHQIQLDTGCKILLAQKAFSLFAAYPYIQEDLAGTTSSGLYEAKLGREYFGKEVHVFSPAYTETDFTQLLDIADHIVFNSFAQWHKYETQVQEAPRKISCGIRINPGYAEVETDLYNPCIPGSRMGVPLEQMETQGFNGLDGIHFHTMCEQNSDVLERTLDHVIPQFDPWLKRSKWINFGGGHHITRPDYDVDKLVQCIRRVQVLYPAQIYLEPGEAVALQAGYLVASVVDIVHNGIDIAILDASAACHMPDVLEMPYRPDVIGSGQPHEKTYTYRFAGNTCLAGDVIGDYSFDTPLHPGDRVVFCDMAIYSMVKNNTFNGMPLPDILLYLPNHELQLVKHFGYQDFLSRLS